MVNFIVQLPSLLLGEIPSSYQPGGKRNASGRQVGNSSGLLCSVLHSMPPSHPRVEMQLGAETLGFSSTCH